MRVTKTFKIGSFFVAMLLALQIVIAPLSVGAFSAYGAGTSGNPYRISTCSQLQEINNNLAGYYVLVADINCYGVSFTYLGTFTGTLDGRNNKITNLSINDKGLFDNVNNGTVKNIWIVNGSVTGGYVGSFASTSNGSSQFINVHSGMTLSNTASYSGGIVGDMNGTSSISKSSFTGTITSTSGYVGGLAGDLWDSGTSITDSFSSGTFNSGTPYAAGITAGNFSGTINRVYSGMTFNTGSNYNGGLVGVSQTPISNSFSAVTRTGSGGSYNAVIGSDSGGTSTNNYFDITTNGTSTCGVGSGCTGVNSGNSNPNYFKNNSTNAPLNSWDFTNVWQTTSGYPTLRGISDFENPTVPNLGDANGDSTDDAFQPYVGSVSDTNGVFSTVTVPSAGGCTMDTPTSTANGTISTDTGFNPLVNLTGFTLYCPSAGATVPVTIIYDKQYDTSRSVLRQYNSTTQAYATVAGATFGTTTVGGVTKSTVTYNLTDGGAYDQDGTANGAIVDPVTFSNPNTTTATAPNTGVAQHQPNVLLNIVVALLAITIFVIARRHQKTTL
ncbi:MAG: choice-of-anchor U domain-containing protein [Patescibacteria group bacterium]